MTDTPSKTPSKKLGEPQFGTQQNCIKMRQIGRVGKPISHDPPNHRFQVLAEDGRFDCGKP
jgi:hypothetical protein